MSTSFLLLALIVVGLAALVRHFGGFVVRRVQSAAALRRVRAEHARLAQLLEAAEGGAERPFVVTSAAVVEVKAANLGCLRCGERVRVEDHRVEPRAARRLRVVTTVCIRCSFRREVWFELGGAEH